MSSETSYSDSFIEKIDELVKELKNKWEILANKPELKYDLEARLTAISEVRSWFVGEADEKPDSYYGKLEMISEEELNETVVNGLRSKFTEIRAGLEYYRHAVERARREKRLVTKNDEKILVEVTDDIREMYKLLENFMNNKISEKSTDGILESEGSGLSNISNIADKKGENPKASNGDS
ncbi:MAG: hypothetical protein AAGG02_10985 [Cyanobacteria bacterium P01_H01_bin.15]